MKGVYKGAIPHLVGELALLRQPPEESHVLAQFSNVYLTRECLFNAHPPPYANIPDESLGFGWHVFRKEEFEIHS